MLKLALCAVLLGVSLAQFMRYETEGEWSHRRGPFVPKTSFESDILDLEVAPAPRDVDLVIVGMVSGERNPDVFINDIPTRHLFSEGPGQLNNVGKREALTFGRALRERYGGLISEKFFPSEFVSRSSSGESEEMTSQVVNTGLFPPVGRAIFDPEIQWQPVPVTTDDHVLGITRVNHCPTVREVLKPILTGEISVIREVLERERDIVEYIVESTGVRPTIQDLSEVAENLRQMYIKNLPLPEWAMHPVIRGHLMDTETFYHHVQIFRNAVEKACSLYKPCRKVVSGVILTKMVNHIRTVIDEESILMKSTRPHLHTVDNELVKMITLVSDVEVILSVFRVLSLDHFTVPPTGGFILEVRVHPVPSVRVIFHKPDSRIPELRHRFFVAKKVDSLHSRYECPEHFCPIGELLHKMEMESVPSWKEVCHMDTHHMKMYRDTVYGSTYGSGYGYSKFVKPTIFDFLKPKYSYSKMDSEFTPRWSSLYSKYDTEYTPKWSSLYSKYDTEYTPKWSSLYSNMDTEFTPKWSMYRDTSDFDFVKPKYSKLSSIYGSTYGSGYGYSKFVKPTIYDFLKPKYTYSEMDSELTPRWSSLYSKLGSEYTPRWSSIYSNMDTEYTPRWSMYSKMGSEFPTYKTSKYYY